jgi:hypothetical protein
MKTNKCPFKHKEYEIIGYEQYPIYGDGYIACKLIKSGYSFKDIRFNKCVGESVCPIMKK